MVSSLGLGCMSLSMLLIVANDDRRVQAKPLLTLCVSSLVFATLRPRFVTRVCGAVQFTSVVPHFPPCAAISGIKASKAPAKVMA